MLVHDGFMAARDDGSLLYGDVAPPFLLEMLLVTFLYPEIAFVQRVAENTDDRLLFPVIRILFTYQIFSELLLLVIRRLRYLLHIKDFPIKSPACLNSKSFFSHSTVQFHL